MDMAGMVSLVLAMLPLKDTQYRVVIASSAILKMMLSLVDSTKMELPATASTAMFLSLAKLEEFAPATNLL
jgi:hypothetical protein